MKRIQLANNTNLIVNLGLFRCDEHIRFEALAEVPIEQNKSVSEKLKDELKITNRIANTRKIREDRLYIPSAQFPNRFRRRLMWLMLLATTVMLGMFGYIIWGEKTAKVHFILKRNNKEVEVRAIPRMDGMIELEGISEPLNERLWGAPLS
jgi:hypothetical protein